MSLSSRTFDYGQDRALAFQHPTQENRNDAPQMKFLDLPVEVRSMIYKYIFDGAVLRIGKRGIEHENSWGHCEILQTCQAVFKEAKPALFSQATQVFSDFVEENGHVEDQNLNLRPIHSRRVPAMNVYNYEPRHNVRLDIRTLRMYSHLRKLELGMFCYMRFYRAPYHVLADDRETVNDANNPYMITEIKNIIADKALYSRLLYKPLRLAGMRGILRSKHRNFSVLLCCEVELLCVDVNDKLPDNYDGLKVLLDWDNNKLLENELNSTESE